MGSDAFASLEDAYPSSMTAQTEHRPPQSPRSTSIAQLQQSDDSEMKRTDMVPRNVTQPTTAAWYDADQKAQQQSQLEFQFAPSIVEMYSHKQKDVLKTLVAALTVALGMAIFWFGKRVFAQTFKADDLSNTQTILAYACLPMSIVLVIWTVKVFFPNR